MWYNNDRISVLHHSKGADIMLNEYSIDLHMHSQLSDGQATPVEVVDKAAEVGLKKIVLCDHNVVHPNYSRLRAYAETKGVELPFMGCEASVTFFYDRIPAACFHMLVYGEDDIISSPEFTAAVSRFDDHRNKIALRELRKLVMAGAPITYEDAFIFDRDIAPFEKSEKYTDGHLYRCIAKNLGITEQEAQERYKDCKESYQYGKFGWLHQLSVMPDACELISLARRLGLVTVVAHPTWMDCPFILGDDPTFEQRAEMIRIMRDHGLDGIETCHEMLNAEERAQYEALADELGLITTGGSDYHAEEDYGRHLTEYGASEEKFRAIADLVHSRAAEARMRI